ncbi:MAG: ATP-dependent RNA helicase, partial [Deltaproteobacteria bacterium]|nr:ATP-dependent RNA helicase [Deltaproteobacteria bacterium]
MTASNGCCRFSIARPRAVQSQSTRCPLQPLPIDPLLPQIADVVRRERRLVLEAPPGAGKTTRVPPALLGALANAGQSVLVLEPRRLAARLAARRVADERGETLGGSVGYQVRFDSALSPDTRLLYLTEGLFSRRLLEDRDLAGVGCVVLDEFHERHLHTDLALAWVWRLMQSARPDLQLVVMSATLESGPVAALLDRAPVLRAAGQRFEVAIEHLPESRKSLALQVRAAVARSLRDGLDGDVLVFVPGAAEIRRCLEALTELAAASGLELHALHGDLPPAEQDAAIRPGARRKIIVSTNVAESSITVANVAVVIDSGLARIASHRPWSGLPALEVRPIARAAVEQRTGRAGRTRAGRCLRLYGAADLATRPSHERPEIARSDLSELALTVAQLVGRADDKALSWLDAPPAPAWSSALDLLRRLSALDTTGALTTTGRQLLRWPTHPRIGRLLLEAHRRGVFEPACAIAALLGERDIVARRGLERRAAAAAVSGSDLIDRGELLAVARGARFAEGALERLGLDPAAVRTVERARQQLLSLRPTGEPARASADERERRLQQSTLAAFADRVARRRPNTRTLVLASGGEALLAEE